FSPCPCFHHALSTASHRLCHNTHTPPTGPRKEKTHAPPIHADSKPRRALVVSPCNRAGRWGSPPTRDPSRRPAGAGQPETSRGRHLRRKGRREAADCQRGRKSKKGKPPRPDPV